MKFVIIVMTLCALVMTGCSSRNVDQGITFGVQNGQTESGETEDEKAGIEEKPIVIPAQNIYNANGVCIDTRESTEIDGELVIPICIENNSDETYDFYLVACALNGVADTYLFQLGKVPSGNKLNKTVSFPDYYIEEFTTGPIEYIDLVFYAPCETTLGEELDIPQVTLVTNYGEADKRYFPNGETVFEENGISINFIREDSDKYVYAITNNSGIDVDLSIENLSINDYVVSEMNFDLTHILIPNECYAYFSIQMDEEFMTQNFIEQIEKITFVVHVFGDNHWGSEPINGLTK